MHGRTWSRLYLSGYFCGCIQRSLPDLYPRKLSVEARLRPDVLAVLALSRPQGHVAEFGESKFRGAAILLALVRDQTVRY